MCASFEKGNETGIWASPRFPNIPFNNQRMESRAMELNTFDLAAADFNLLVKTAARSC